MAAPIGTSELCVKIRTFATLSRIGLLLLQVIFNLAIPDHDAGVFNPPFHSQMVSESPLDKLVDIVLSGFRRWDAVYFLQIAENGYLYENTLAFFPLYPLVIRGIANSVFLPFQYFLTYSNILLLTSVAVNVILFIKSAETLFELGRHVIGNDIIAYKASLLFCISPASVFFSAPYSECLYFYLTVNGLLNLEKSSMFKAVVFLGLSFSARSNGVLNIGYFLFVVLKKTIGQMHSLWNAAMRNIQMCLTIPWIFMTFTVIPYTFMIMVCVMPFILYQLYCYKLYCVGDFIFTIPDSLIQYAKENNLKLQGSNVPSTWCNDSIPLAYSYVQKQYWDQGFLKYWELKQIPNFLLATPVALLSVKLGLTFYRHNKYICLTLGLDDAGAAKKESYSVPEFRLEGVTLLPYVLHTFAVTVFGWFCIHVQVMTRLLFSSCPVLYWYCAHLISENFRREPRFNKFDITKSGRPPAAAVEPGLRDFWKNILVDQIVNFKLQSRTTKLILSYFLGYFVVGTAMFSNFLPWT